jgi:hypothetical protein
MNVASLGLCKELFELAGWDNDASKPHEIEKVWMRSYHTSALGGGHPDYGNPKVKQREVVVGDWQVTDDPRHRVSIPEVVFEWWYREVKKLEQEAIPAYDLSFLLRKLPDVLKMSRSKIGYTFYVHNVEVGIRPFSKQQSVVLERATADTPEDAAAMLAIELHKQGIFSSREDQDPAEPHQ